MSSIKEKSSKFWDNTLTSGIYLLAVVLLIFISVPPFIENETASRVSILILSTVTIGLTILLLPSNANSKRNRWMMVVLLALPWLMGLSFELNIFILSVLSSFSNAVDVHNSTANSYGVVLQGSMMVLGYIILTLLADSDYF